MKNLTQQEVVAWLRSQARKLSEAADALSSEAGGTGSVTLDMLKERLQKGSSRVPQLAKEFGVDQSVLRAMVAKRNSGIVTHTRGWLKLKENPNGAKS